MIEIPKPPAELLEAILFETELPRTVVELDEASGLGEDEIKKILLDMKNRGHAVMNNRFRWRLSNERRLALLKRCNVSPVDRDAMNEDARRPPVPAPATRKDPTPMSITERVSQLQREAQMRLAAIPAELEELKRQYEESRDKLRAETQELHRLLVQLGARPPAVNGSGSVLSPQAQRALEAICSGMSKPTQIANVLYGDPQRHAAARSVIKGLMARGKVRQVSRGVYEAI